MLLAKDAAEGCTSQAVDTCADTPAAPMTLCYLVGDLDCDGDVDVDDIMMVASRWRMTDIDPDWNPRYDLDNDGIVTVVDIMKVAAHWGLDFGQNHGGDQKPVFSCQIAAHVDLK